MSHRSSKPTVNLSGKGRKILDLADLIVQNDAKKLEKSQKLYTILAYSQRDDSMSRAALVLLSGGQGHDPLDIVFDDDLFNVSLT